ncbi:MAG: AN1-type zinc finger domain-containing protein [Methanoregula sp.]|nr:AN1-type zinc finger domain-containing protein [Methanoregula sp.]
MTRCDHCGNETTMPFTCQHCGGKYCADCRLPPNHSCTGLGSWNRKPRPAVGMSYSRGGGVSATGGVATDARRRPAKNATGGIPYLKIMIAIIVLVLLGLAGLIFSGYRP